jgi:mannose-6-phosphate isomerase
LVLCEVQQPLDVTYRLYDYDRGRELHLEEGIAVASLKPYYSRQPKQPAGEGRKVLVDCPWFLTERLTLSGSLTIAPRPRAAIYIALQGEGELAGLPFQVGDAIDIPAGNEAVCASGRATLLVAAEP